MDSLAKKKDRSCNLFFCPTLKRPQISFVKISVE